MPRKDYIIVLWFFGLAIITGINATMLGNAGSIAAIITGVISVFSAIALILRWLYRRQLLRDPLEVYYFIPRYQYPEKQFPGAPQKEEHLSELTVGIGIYSLIFITFPRTNFSIDIMRFLFSEPERHKPKDLGEGSSISVSHSRDWYGNIQPANPVGQPIVYHKGIPRTMVRQIQTTATWDGEAIFEFFIRESYVIQKKLKFHVSSEDYSDQIPFLRVRRQ